MKKILFVILCCFCISDINAQVSFGWLPNDTIIQNVDPNSYTEMLIEQQNLTNDTLQLEVEVVYNDAPTTWDGMICLHGTCLGSIQPVGFVGLMDPIYGATNGYTKLTVYPAGGTESMMLRIRVYDVNNPTDGDTCTWIVNSVSTTSISDNPKLNLSVFPNPTNKTINIVSGVDFDNVRIYDLQGKEVFFNTYLSTTKKTINLESLPAGIYMLHTYDNDNKNGIQKITIYE
jgi:hypothetical protein